MSKKQLKALTVVFGMSIGGIICSFGMSVYTAVQQHQAEKQPAPLSIPTPALGS